MTRPSGSTLKMGVDGCPCRTGGILRWTLLFSKRCGLCERSSADVHDCHPTRKVSVPDFPMRYAMRPYDPSQVRKFIEKAKEFTKWLSEH